MEHTVPRTAFDSHDGSVTYKALPPSLSGNMAVSALHALKIGHFLHHCHFSYHKDTPWCLPVLGFMGFKAPTAKKLLLTHLVD